ncbi:DUF6337 family protein [Piscinibacter sp.]|uniref:DUF6337 family protein n=1 Tax=Piscinibacter sp. TaxID=1903157 RepID=UPI0039E52499
MSLAAAAVLALLSLAFGKLDRWLWGSALTPGVVLASGYAVIVLIYGIARSFYDFAEVRWITYAALALFIAACMLCSVVAAATLHWRRSEIHTNARGTGAAASIVLVLVLAVFLPVAVVTSIANGGLWSTGARDAMSSGPIGHLHVLLAFATVWYAVGGRGDAWRRALLLATALAALSLYPVKGWTLIPLTAVIFAVLYRSRTTSSSAWKYLPLLALTGTAVFFTIYVARADLGAADGEVAAGVLSAVFEHFLFYLTAGLFGLDAVVAGLQLPGGPILLFAPLHNMLAILTGDLLVSSFSSVYVEGMESHDTGGNVFSFLGSLVGYGGVLVGVATAGLIVTLAYILLGLAWRMRAAPLRAAALYVLATLAFGWFDYYLWLLTPWEVLVIGVLVALPALSWRRRST